MQNRKLVAELTRALRQHDSSLFDERELRSRFVDAIGEWNCCIEPRTSAVFVEQLWKLCKNEPLKAFAKATPKAWIIANRRTFTLAEVLIMAAMNMGIWAEGDACGKVSADFHFSPRPAVTAGFIGIQFDKNNERHPNE